MMPSVVIYRLGSLGDTIVALPCFHRIAQSFPDAERILLTNVPVSTKAAPVEAVLKGSGLVHRVLAYPLSLRSPRALLGLRTQLRDTGADTLVYLAEKRGLLIAWRDWLFFRACGFRRIVGAPLTPDLQDNRVDGVTGELEPERERLARTLASLGAIDLDSTVSWDLKLNEEEEAAGLSAVAPFAGRPFLAINMGGKVADKDWRIPNWQKALQALGRSFPGVGLLVVGAAEDSERARAVIAHWPGVGIDRCGKLSVRETAAALQHAAAFIGHDSGPLHLAAVRGVRCVGLFGSYNRPRQWHPHGTGHRIIHRMEGVSAITVAEVIAAASDILGEAGLTMRQASHGEPDPEALEVAP
jgi:ADP-heptose:LPS heptosyltransferase